MQGWQDGLNMVDEEVNSEHLRKPKKANRNIDSSVHLTWGELYPERNVDADG